MPPYVDGIKIFDQAAKYSFIIIFCDLVIFINPLMAKYSGHRLYSGMEKPFY